MTAFEDLVRETSQSRVGLSTMAALMSAAPMRNPAQQALQALSQQSAEIAELAKSHSNAVLKMVADIKKSVSVSSSAMTQVARQAEAMSRIAQAARPDPALLKAFRDSQLRVAHAAELFNKNAALLAAQKLDIRAVRLVNALPNMRALAARLRRDKRGHAVLDEAGFELVYHFVGGAFAAELASVSPQVRGAAVTNKLLRLTQGEDFEIRLSDVFRQTPILQRRWPIVSQALRAHRRREYWIAIPLLMSQLEGLTSDALVLNSIARKIKGKFYELDTSGKLRLNKNAKPIELTGLVKKIARFDPADHETIQGVADLIHGELAGKRNLVLHGSDVRYGKAKLSTQLLLALYIWALEIAAFVS